jgi:eukaryotic-like serine/threonine-protein kinase
MRKVDSIVGSRYQLVKHLGSGGMADVYLARDLECAEFFVALKLFEFNSNTSRDLRIRAKNELRAMFNISHPNVVKVYDAFEDKGILGISLEFMNFGDLRTRTKSGTFTLSQIYHLIEQVCYGLKAIHDSGIIHRDIKAENILLSTSGAVKVSDFGVAQFFAKDKLTPEGYLVGTSQYLCPEYVINHKITPAGDIYAFGSLLFVILSGKLPYVVEDTNIITLDRFEDKNRRRLIVENKNIPLPLVMIIERMIAPDINARYLNVNEILEDLKAVNKTEVATDKTISWYNKEIRSY